MDENALHSGNRIILDERPPASECGNWAFLLEFFIYSELQHPTRESPSSSSQTLQLNPLLIRIRKGILNACPKSQSPQLQKRERKPKMKQWTQSLKWEERPMRSSCPGQLARPWLAPECLHTHLIHCSLTSLTILRDIPQTALSWQETNLLPHAHITLGAVWI